MGPAHLRDRAVRSDTVVLYQLGRGTCHELLFSVTAQKGTGEPLPPFSQSLIKQLQILRAELGEKQNQVQGQGLCAGGAGGHTGASQSHPPPPGTPIMFETMISRFFTNSLHPQALNSVAALRQSKTLPQKVIS